MKEVDMVRGLVQVFLVYVFYVGFYFGRVFIVGYSPILFVFQPFALMQKVEPKNQGKPNRSACFAGPAHRRRVIGIDHFLLS
jgi:hypothetical protein